MNRRLHASLDAYTHPIIWALKSIVAEPLFVSLSPHTTDPEVRSAVILPPKGRPLRLRVSDQHLWLRFRVSFLVVATPDAPTAIDVTQDSYSFQLFRGDGRTQFDEIVAYHWTPNDPAAKRSWPHLHIGSAFIDPAARREPLALHKTHFFTGPITAPGFVRMAVEEFGVQPVVADWQERLVEDGVRT